ncbi:MAG: ECF transporter S component [Eubacteriales bacterium]|nr:ECF transporter S component [Eubacteriales bacterium]
MKSDNLSEEKMSKTQFITRTAILLALTLVFQYLGRFVPLGPNSNFVVGPLVNACLLVAGAMVGLGGAAIISVLAPLFAALTNTTATAPFVLLFSPFIALGNFVFVLFFVLFRKKGKAAAILGTGIGAVIKFLILYGGVILMLGVKKMPAPAATALTFMFSWPQLVTAAIGAVIAFAVIGALERANKIPKTGE